ncbi:cadherin-related family member 5 isoform X1 [Heterocephalus glaber]|uniref:Cadherin-related family member 5 n=1 Tax=Heterocephalus glaber TaxID=10181 RepID=A0AAX6TGC1_HETGA|nr:cadherin-related family member 5 isoform X1 [Heterocephalus glaber]
MTPTSPPGGGLAWPPCGSPLGGAVSRAIKQGGAWQGKGRSRRRGRPSPGPQTARPFRQVTATKMGARAPLWASLLLLLALPGQPPGAAAQGQVCSVDRTFVSVEENSSVAEPLVNISIPDGQHVTLGPSSSPSAFRILVDQLFLNVTPDYEDSTMLEAHLECRRGSSVVTQLVVLVSVLDVNDNAPEFPFETKEQNVSEDTRVGSIVIPEDQLKASDKDSEDVLFYTLQEVTPNARSFFSLVSANRPALRLDQALDFYKWQDMTLQLLVRDTQEETEVPSHRATATLVLHVLPADLRPPWFLPCSYSDGYVCIQAQYHGAVPKGHTLPSPLILHPGPIYAVDGDQGIDARIIYSIVGGNTDNTFAVDKDSGNLTMAKSIPSPTTFILLIRADQADLARYSVTQATVEARSATGNPPRFPQSLYRGIVPPGSEAGVTVRDAASPTQPLRIQAQDPDFLGLNSAVTYRITNCSEFRMDGETMLTTLALEHEGVFYAEVEATNTATNDTATAVAEIWVSEQKPPTIGPPEIPPSPEAGRTNKPSTSTAMETPRPPRTPQGPSSTSPGGATGPHPSSGTSLRPAASTTPGGLPGVGASTILWPGTPGGVSAPTPKPGTSRPTTPGSSGSSSASGTPGVGSTGEDEPGRPEELRFSTVDMAVLGGVLSALLLLALTVLAVLLYKHYGHRLSCCSGKAAEPQPHVFDNQAFRGDHGATETSVPSPEPGPTPAEMPPAALDPEPLSPAPPNPEPLAPEPPVATGAGDSPSAVRSILTKERRPGGGYKAVWFGGDIGAAADVVVLSAPEAGRDGEGDSEGSSEEDGGRDGGPRDASGSSTRI